MRLPRLSVASILIIDWIPFFQYQQYSVLSRPCSCSSHYWLLNFSLIVQSYADMVSEQSSQADDLTFGSPNYPTNGSLKDTTIVEENSMENSSEKKNTDSGNEDVGGRGYRDQNQTIQHYFYVQLGIYAHRPDTSGVYKHWCSALLCVATIINCTDCITMIAWFWFVAKFQPRSHHQHCSGSVSSCNIDDRDLVKLGVFFSVFYYVIVAY